MIDFYERVLPEEIENPHIVKWLDEAGRVGNCLVC
jgi:hypothetical protein